MTMLDAVYVDTVEEKRTVGIRPRPAFQPLLEMAIMREGSGIFVVVERPPDEDGLQAVTRKQPPPNEPVEPGGPEAEDLPCSWWRRGRVELPVQRASRSGCATGLAVLVFHYRGSDRQGVRGSQPMSLWPPYRRRASRTPNCSAQSAPSGAGAGGRSRYVKRLGLAVLARQLLLCHLFTRCGGASACNPAGKPAVEPARPHECIISPGCGVALPGPRTNPRSAASLRKRRRSLRPNVGG